MFQPNGVVGSGTMLRELEPPSPSLLWLRSKRPLARWQLSGAKAKRGFMHLTKPNFIGLAIYVGNSNYNLVFEGFKLKIIAQIL